MSKNDGSMQIDLYKWSRFHSIKFFMGARRRAPTPKKRDIIINP